MGRLRSLRQLSSGIWQNLFIVCAISRVQGDSSNFVAKQMMLVDNGASGDGGAGDAAPILYA